MAGFGLSIVVGVLLGFLIGSSRAAYAAVYPLTMFLRILFAQILVLVTL